MHILRRHPQTVHPPDTTAEFTAGPLPDAEAPRSLDVAGHHLTVFVESPPLLESMTRDILAAKKRVWLETYIFYNDHGGQKIADALKQKAQKGLDVLLLYDAIGSAITPGAFFNSLRKAGVKVHAYHSILEGLRRFRPLTILNRRNHRKMLVIDDAIGYFGGMNIIDNVESVERQEAESRPTSSGWRDVHIRLEGPQQCDLAESFDRSWKSAHGEKVQKRSRKYRRALHLHHALHSPSDPVPESIRFFDSGPGPKYSRAARVFSRLLRYAQFQVTISMAYFIPTGAVLRSLLSAEEASSHPHRRPGKIRCAACSASDILSLRQTRPPRIPHLRAPMANAAFQGDDR